MNDPSPERVELERLTAAVRDTVASGRDMQARVRDLMIAAFRNAGVSLASMQALTRAALQGVDAGTMDTAGDKGTAARHAVAGIEDALMHAAEASSLAIREAAGHASGFAKTDLKRAIDELASLESLFIDTVTEVARAGSASAAAGFADIQRHLQHSGSTFGERLAEHIGDLQRLLTQTGQEQLQSGAEAAGRAVEQIGRLAGSLLAGIQAGLAGTGDGSGRNRNTRGSGDV